MNVIRMLAALVGVFFAVVAVGDDAIPAELLTAAEKSAYRATALHAEVVELVDRLAARSPLAFRTTLGKSAEGRELPLLVIADPPVRSAKDARAQVERDRKLIVFAIGNIHAGEVDGKEALPMVARELLLTEHHPLLKHLIFAFAPIYNADGNERVSKDNRPGQHGPDDGMGKRENAAGLDLNRDYVKLEAPETKALVAFLNEWDPHIFIDTHTTNGCYHRYVITYEGPKVLAGSAELIKYCRETFLPESAQLVETKYGVPAFWYGDFDREHQKWGTYPAEARYGTSYVGLRNRISVLSEGYSYASYEARVLGTRDYVKAICEYAAEHREEIAKRLREIDAATTAAGADPRADDMVALRSEAIAAPKRAVARGFVETRDADGNVTIGDALDYEVELWTHFKPTLSVRRPFAYAIPPGMKAVTAKLRAHGIVVEELTATVESAGVEAYTIDRVTFAERPFQNHKLASIDATMKAERRRLGAGWAIVRTGQPLGSLAVYLLEPQCEDGLTTWNYFDDALEVGKEFPVLRVPGRVELATRALTNE